MPAGTKLDLTVTTNVGGNNYKMVTYMTREDIDQQIFGPFPLDIAPTSCFFRGLNEHDEEIILKIKRSEIQGYMVGPYHIKVQAQPMSQQMVPPNLRGRQ